MARFERAASASRTLRSSQTEPHPDGKSLASFGDFGKYFLFVKDHHLAYVQPFYGYLRPAEVWQSALQSLNVWNGSAFPLRLHASAKLTQMRITDFVAYVLFRSLSFGETRMSLSGKDMIVCFFEVLA